MANIDKLLNRFYNLIKKLQNSFSNLQDSPTDNLASELCLCADSWACHHCSEAVADAEIDPIIVRPDTQFSKTEYI